VFFVTKEWLFAYSNQGAWTRAQIEALGFDYPPEKGWLKIAVGMTIGPDQKRDFEEAGSGPFRVTWDWLYRNLPPNEKWWSRAQLETIGVTWPPTKGSISSRVGQEIAHDQKRRFEVLGRSSARTSSKNAS
jgi:hypothetical protein